MNKVPGPPSSSPLPAPSPNLPQPNFSPTPPPSMVFATPTPPPMNPTAQTRQQFYPVRPALPTNPARAQASSAPRPIPPPHGTHTPHVFQPGSQMMMIPTQSISFPNSQGPAYYIPGQYRPSYVSPQQYQVAGSPNFYPGSSPAEYAGAYYPAQPQFTPPVATAPVLMNPAPQQQQAPPPPQHAGPAKRERKQIRIRDPNQGGRDITEEIMSGGRSASTPTPPQSALTMSEGEAITQSNGEKATPPVTAARGDDLVKHVVSLEFPVPPGEIPIPDAPPTPPPTSPISDTVDAPPPTIDKATQLKDAKQQELKSSSAAVPSSGSTENGAGPATVSVLRPASGAEPALESPIAQPEELQFVNGLTADANRDVSPLAEPDITKEAPPVFEEFSTRTTKVVSPVLKETPAQVVSETPPLLDVKETSVTSVKETPAPIPTPTPVVTETPSLIAKDTPLSAVKEILAPVAKETPPPVVLEALVEKEMPPPVATETSEPVVKETIIEDPCPVAKETPEPIDKEIRSPAAPVCVAKAAPPSPPALAEEQEDMPPPQTTAPDSTMQAAVSVPKKKRKLKDLNKKETGDVLDAFKEPPPKPEPMPQTKSEQAEPAPVAPPPVEDMEETWEEKEDKLDAENRQLRSPAPATPTEQKYQYKEEQWKPLNPEEKKKYDREFLLRFQFISASMHKPEGLPHISDVVLDKVNKTPLRPLDLSRMNCGPDFTPSFANLGRQPVGGRGPAMGLPGPRRSGQSSSRKEPRKIVLSGVSLNDDIHLSKAENAWRRGGGGGVEVEDAETSKTRELLRRVRGVLNKLTPQMFQPLMKQITEMTIDTEERLKGVIDLVFEKAISEPNFSVAYANMCRCLMGLKVPTSDKPNVMVNFRKLLLNRCQKEFEKDKDDDEIFEKKQKELDAATEEDVRQHLKEELEESKDTARRRSLGNIKFIGELFKLKMLTENIMHDCVVKLLKNHDEESLECLCRLLSTIGKDLDFEKARPRMDQYFNQMGKIIKERKTSSRIRFMLQDVIDLRRNNWVPRRGDQGPKTIEQIHKDAEMEEQREQVKVQQQLLSKKDVRGPVGGGVILGPRGVGPASHRGNPPPDDGWNTVPISTKNRPIDTSRLSKITKPGSLDFNNQLLAPGGKGSWGSWGKGSSGGSGVKPSGDGAAQDSSRTSTLNRFSALQQPPSSSSSSSTTDTDRRIPQRSSLSRERGDRGDRLERGSDRNRPSISKRSFSREKDEWEQRPVETVQRVTSMTDERERARERERERERERAPSKDNMRREPVSTPPPAPSKPALSPEELEKKSTAIIEEYLHINDMKEALQCVSEMNSASLLYLFVRTGIESTLERSTIAREHMGLLLHQLVKAGMLSAQQYYKGLMEVLGVAEDMAIDVPHIWVYLAELITPLLHEGGISMGSLFREVSKPLVPIGKAGDLLAHLLTLLCKVMSHKKVGAMWREAGLSWKDFLSEDEDVNKFVTEKGVDYTLGEEYGKVGSSRKSLSMEELSKQLDQLLQDKSDNQHIFNWVEANLDEQQVSSNTFVRALMSSVCQAAIICETPYKVDSKGISQRAKLLQRYIKDEQKELQALYALQSLMVQMEQPPNLLRMFFDILYDEDIIKEDGFYKWESSKDPAEQQGKGVALKSVTAFFTWLREAEDESDNS
ncbi:eukaryotic translation initiation factor 4 gamma 1-like isoform X1 [Tachysurus vachellii]|uniref:eukaryotic translation initiation factor 4 gamma 1-like isoform X1 n=2 Tax=Tachysurus vachellii TaxID=175792 RepID=UPI00296B2E54|nr:eukaryotic translation initiation factor 4 gamma 1-like isoform X1 [Tachysurus vachellii]XP_060743865.1 eukaryotic translation initiation factor 4 gamma 1-like isoform X1 [Tachysurus vachellii]